jgi:phosphoribosyl 1,2-cyclic phosphodiesterase
MAEVFEPPVAARPHPSAAAITARFWGVRGSIACPGERYLRYGGNTSCIEVRCGSHLIVLDGGTGLRELGVHLGKVRNVDADVLFTHTHMDHIGGLPFFRPLFEPTNRFVLRAGHLAPERSLEDVLHEVMADPVFPVPPSVFSARVEYRDFVAGETLALRPGIEVRTALLYHPQRATGYRIEHRGRSLCYVTDTEHVPGKPDVNILGLARGADVLIYDSTYTDDEFGEHVGWGHSTWQEGVRIAEAAGVGRLVVFHHDPGHDDGTMDGIRDRAAHARPGTVTAREGMVIEL